MVHPAPSKSSDEQSAAEESLINDEEFLKAAVELIDDGEYERAADLAEAVVEKRSAKYGEMALECAASYVVYGRALLLHAKQHVDLVANEQLKEHLEKMIKEQLRTGDQLDASDDRATAKKEHVGVREEQEESDDEEERDGHEAQAPTIKHETDQSDPFEEAWVWLDLARVIYKKDGTKLEELSEVYRLLAEHGLENENLDRAIEDFNECLKIQKQIYPSLDRRISETCYYLGRAYDLAGDYVNSCKSFNEAAETFRQLINEAQKKSAEDQTTDIKDLQSILDEIDQNIVEIQKKSDEKPDEGSSEVEVEEPHEPIKSMVAFGNQVEPENQSSTEETAKQGEVRDLGVLGRRKQRSSSEEPAAKRQKNE